MKKCVFLVSFIFSIFCVAETTPVQKEKAPAIGLASQVTVIDVAKQESTVGFIAIGRPSLIKISGEKGRLTGKIEYIKDEFSAELHVKLSEITTGISMRDEHMKEKYLQIKEFPEAILKVQKLKLSQNPMTTKMTLKDLPFSGQLTVHGVESPVEGLLNIDSQSANLVNIVATTKTTLSNHKIEVPSYMGIKVADEVQIKSELKIQN